MDGATLRLVDNALLEDVWIDGIAKIETIAPGTYRLLLYRDRCAIDGNDVDREVRLSLLVSAAALTALCAALNAAPDAGVAIARISLLMH